MSIQFSGKNLLRNTSIALAIPLSIALLAATTEPADAEKKSLFKKVFGEFKEGGIQLKNSGSDPSYHAGGKRFRARDIEAEAAARAERAVEFQSEKNTYEAEVAKAVAEAAAQSEATGEKVEPILPPPPKKIRAKDPKLWNPRIGFRSGEHDPAWTSGSKRFRAKKVAQ